MIPYGRQVVSSEDVEAVRDALLSDWLTTGPRVQEFEDLLSRTVQSNYCIAVSSGTAALHSAYAALGISHGDEVITTPNTFIATQATAAMLGGSIVFADVEEETGNIDALAVQALVSRRTRLVVGVDYAGHPFDIDSLRRVTAPLTIPILQDAAHSLGSRYKSRPVGSLADVTTFSFFPTKNITSGEGGAVTCDSKLHADRVRLFSRQGMIRDEEQYIIRDQGPWHQEVHDFGLNYRLPDVLCALGIAQLGRLEAFAARRRQIKSRYDRGLDGLEGVQVPFQSPDAEVVWHLYPLRVKDGRRLHVYKALQKRGIAVQVNYMPAYWHPVFEKMGYRRGLCPVAERLYEEELSLPIHVGLPDEQVDQVIEAVWEALK